MLQARGKERGKQEGGEVGRGGVIEGWGGEGGISK